MADKRMNQFQQVTDAEYVYVEDMNGSQGKIEWNNIIKKIITKSLENKNFLSVYLANLHTSFLCNLIYPTFITLSVYIN